MAKNWRSAIDPAKMILSVYWRTSRWMLVLVALIVLCASIASISAPYIFSRLIDQLAVAPEMILPGFILYALLFGVATALQQVVQLLSLMSSENLGFIASTSFFDRLLKKTTSFFVIHNPAEIQNAAMRGQQALSVVVQLGLIVFIPGVTQIALTLVLLGATINIELVVIVLLYGIGFVMLTYFANKHTRPHFEAAFEAMQENARFVGNAINGMETLRQFGSDKWLSHRFVTLAREARDGWRRVVSRRIAYSAIFGLGLAMQFALTFALLLPRYRAGDLSVGDVVLFNALLLQLNRPFEMIGYAMDDIVQAFIRFMPFASMWGAPEEKDSAAHQPLVLQEGRVTFEDVSFAYEGGRGVEHVSFSAKRGRVTYLTGETGSGKSTVFRLALRSIMPDQGRILVDSTDLQDVARTDWFAVIGVVPQHIMLLNESLRANIVLGREFDAARLRRAAQRAAILDFIEALPEGFDTGVGERGLKLSGGERQRVAIARALYADPKILFLDEASSALDEATEKDIMRHIRAVAGEVTVIAITHRKSVIAPDDHVVRMHEGQTLIE